MRIKKIFDNADFSEVLKKGFIALIIRLLGFASGYFFIYFTVRFFGPETQGRLALSFSIMIIGSLICRFGVDINFVKIFAITNNIENAKGIYYKLSPYILLITLLISGMIFTLAEPISHYVFDDHGLTAYIKWTAPCVTFFTFVLLNASVLRGLKFNTIYSFLFNGGRFLFTLLIFGVLFTFWKENPQITIIAHTLSIFILLIISIYFIRKYLYPKHKNTNYQTINFIKQSLPMLFSTSMIIFLGWSDTLILGIYKTSELVGIYSVILKVAVITSFTFQAIDSILAPKLSSAYHDNDTNLFRRLIRFSTTVNLIVSILAVLGIFILRNFILEIFGEEFKVASTALIILCVGQLFNAICGPVGSILQMTGHQKIFQNVLFIALIINITLNLILIKPYGVNGVAIATATSLAFWNIASLMFIKRKIYI